MIDKVSRRYGVEPRRQLMVSPMAYQALEKERHRLLRKTGVLKPRYEIASDIICAALGVNSNQDKEEAI